MALNGLSNPSAYRARKEGTWEALADRIAGCLLDRQLDDIETELEFNPYFLPESWYKHAREEVEKKREELRAENISQILLDRYDFF